MRKSAMTLFFPLSGLSSGTLHTKSARVCARGREFHHPFPSSRRLLRSRFANQEKSKRDIVTTAISSSSLDDIKTKGWVVFSDVHVSRKTKDIALETLKHVHAIAAKENRGILFLGDFWHHRGALPVETLNEIIRELAKWTQPTIMLVGNHDQVNVNGSVHALEVLRMCNPEKICVFDEPRVWRGAMWLPYRKDQEMMRRTVEELMERHSKKRSSNVAVAVEEEIKTVFCHADVMGANVNQTFQMKNGVDSKETFSEGIESIISGHYHKPHFVERDSRVRYVGSPYQISRAEKNQEKHLLFLNDKWRDESLTDADVLKRSKIDIGPRYFDIDETIGESIETIAGDLRANDIVRWTIPFDSSLSAMEEEDADAKRAKTSRKRASEIRVSNRSSTTSSGVEIDD
jgi:UDP-2,3-diacylglucosamine pyrophosphatase LpxH